LSWTREERGEGREVRGERWAPGPGFNIETADSNSNYLNTESNSNSFVTDPLPTFHSYTVW
jgi:hypothetical protein